MSCGTCKCNFCAYNCNLPAQFVTIGEVNEVCFTCDDCKHWGGDCSKRSMWRPDCPNYLEPQKLTEHRAQQAERCAQVRRAKLHIVKPSDDASCHIPQNHKK